MKCSIKTLFAGLFLLTLPACGGSSGDAPYDPLLPLPAAAKEPDDAAMRDAVRIFLAGTKAPASSVYKFVRQDLNGDGRREALVLFKNPYGYWCDFYGCTLLVLKAHENHFTPLNTIKQVREPVYVSDRRTNDWKDIIVHVSGRWSKTKDVALHYSGGHYPSDPSTLPPVTLETYGTQQPAFTD